MTEVEDEAGQDVAAAGKTSPEFYREREDKEKTKLNESAACVGKLTATEFRTVSRQDSSQ